MTKLSIGMRVPGRTVDVLGGARVRLPNAEHLTHLQFRRFAGCPICNSHLRSVALRSGEIAAAGILEIAVFHSEAATMLPYQGDLPFAVVADPEKRLYREFGVEESLRALFDPRSLPAVFRGMTSSTPSNPLVGEGGHLGLPAEFLIRSTGEILDLHYGTHAADHWSVDELLRRALPFA